MDHNFSLGTKYAEIGTFDEECLPDSVFCKKLEKKHFFCVKKACKSLSDVVISTYMLKEVTG